MRWILIAIVALAATGCGDFEDPAIVIDLRVLGMTVEPPEIVTPFDPENPGDVVLDDVEVCALVADPADSRRLAWNMVACAPTDSHRCDEPDATFVDIGFGTIDDPEESPVPVQLCGTLPANAALAAVLEEAVSLDALAGFGGVAVQIELFVRPEDGTLDDAVFATKRMLYSPQIPVERVANVNPTLDDVLAEVLGSGSELPLPNGRCGDVTPMEVPIDGKLKLTPREPTGVREDYLLPTFDGGSRMFTETLTYSWFASDGDWSRPTTGGPKDFAGNKQPIDTNFKANIDPGVVGNGLDVRLWIIQRDERGGQAWFESCVRVVR